MPEISSRIVVSIIVLNRNGVGHLKNLLPAISANVPSVKYELIIVDNGSTDQSLAYLKNNRYGLPVYLIENTENLSFSAANNQAAKRAKGEYLLLLNNDVIPTEKWFQPLFSTIQGNRNIASVGSKLVYPQKRSFKFSGKVQHAGIVFQDEGDFIRPYNLGNGFLMDQPLVCQSQSRAALTAACLLIDKDKFIEVGGFDEVYQYGFEDVDLGLKFLQSGYENYYCAESMLIHYEFGTQSKDRRADVVERRQRNLQHFRNRWFHYLKKVYWTEKIRCKPSFYVENSLSIVIVGHKGQGLCTTVYVESLMTAFDGVGWLIVDKTGLRSRDIQISQEVDLVLSLSSSFNIRKIGLQRKRLFKVLWIGETTPFEKVQGRKPLYAEYDLIFDISGNNATIDNPVMHSLHYITSAFPKGDALQIADNRMNKWAQELRVVLLKILAGTSIAIKLPMRKWEDCRNWGDYYLAWHLKDALIDEGFGVVLQIVSEWGDRRGNECNVAIALRGVVRYEPNNYQLNLMWNISHPESVQKEEYERYDRVFIASQIYVKKLEQLLSVPVEVMLQCTDPSRFYEPDQETKIKYQHQLLFIGNSRKAYNRHVLLMESIHEGFSRRLSGGKSNQKRVLSFNRVSRKVIRDLLPTQYDLAVYGLRWDKLIAKQIIKGRYIPNDELYQYYGSADILLNDHWKDMRECGFISNRIFDGLACGAFIITDNIQGVGDLEQYIITYSSKEELKQQVGYYLSHSVEREKVAQAGKEHVLKNHTFAHRAKQFSGAIHFWLSEKQVL